MNSKHTLLILGAIITGAMVFLSVNAHALPVDSSIFTAGGNHPIVSSNPRPLVVMVDDPLVVSVKPIFPPIKDDSPSSVFYPSSGLNGGQRTGITEDELAVILSSTRRYNHSTNQWETFTWSGERRENLITSWAERNPARKGSNHFVNSDKPVKVVRKPLVKWKPFGEQFLKKE